MSLRSMENKRFKLLPFKFTRINGKELLVSETGDFYFAPEGTVKKIVDRNIAVDSELYKDLLSKYIICDDYNAYIQDIVALKLRTKKSFLDNFTALHIFVLTLRCNQKCIYCQASSQYRPSKKMDMSINDLDAAISLMLKSPNPCITMEFQGGESSLALDLVEHAIIETERRNEEIGKDIKYVICTNLVEVSDKLITLCEKYNVFVSTSLDGPKYVHDYNRGIRGSYDIFVKSLITMREKIGISMVSPLMTTSDFSLAYPIEIIDAYRALGFRNIFLRPLNPYGRALKEDNWKNYFIKFIDFYKKALDYIIELNQKGEVFTESFTAMILRKILTPFPIGFVDLQSPAGIINSVIVYNYDGNVYCSDESRMMAENNDYTFMLGSVHDSYESLFYGEKAQELSKVWATEYIAGCSDCAFQQFCGADPVRNYSTQGDWYGYRPTSLFCMFHKEVITHLFSLIQKRGNEVLPIFRRWAYER